jgi:hypothetical protein
MLNNDVKKGFKSRGLICSSLHGSRICFFGLAGFPLFLFWSWIFITTFALWLYYVDYLSFTLCINFMFLPLCYLQGRCCRIFLYFRSLFLFLCCLSFVEIVFGNIHCVGAMRCYRMLRDYPWNYLTRSLALLTASIREAEVLVFWHLRKNTEDVDWSLYLYLISTSFLNLCT